MLQEEQEHNVRASLKDRLPQVHYHPAAVIYCQVWSQIYNQQWNRPPQLIERLVTSVLSSECWIKVKAVVKEDISLNLGTRRRSSRSNLTIDQFTLTPLGSAFMFSVSHFLLEILSCGFEFYLNLDLAGDYFKVASQQQSSPSASELGRFIKHLAFPAHCAGQPTELKNAPHWSHTGWFGSPRSSKRRKLLHWLLAR